jgi:cyclophilin family peptidyl-prolyl cis-trans isomerase
MWNKLAIVILFLGAAGISAACSGEDGSQASAAALQSAPSAPGGDDDKSMKSDPAIKEIRAFIAKQKIDKSNPRWKQSLKKPPKLDFDPDTKYFWHLETNKGDIKIQLAPEVAPMHCSSAIYLALLGFYDDLTFHRVIRGFMAQGGDPTGTGSGRPGYLLDAEFNDRKHVAGTVSMARASDPNSAGSQFFICFGATPNLDDKYTVFGQVVSGMDTVKKLEEAADPMARNGVPPKEKLVIKKATISVE